MTRHPKIGFMPAQAGAVGKVDDHIRPMAEPAMAVTNIYGMTLMDAPALELAFIAYARKFEKGLSEFALRGLKMPRVPTEFMKRHFYFLGTGFPGERSSIFGTMPSRRPKLFSMFAQTPVLIDCSPRTQPNVVVHAF
jgi:hypothetical protein